ncbi:hypothetical protein H6P81_021734 [Aristolochia fimbriata]|uniref:Uncharacterized protein n=1 Tax=Aristolochia fimbriata TaxID=158543 RepID=A0AAV7DSW4_ARIFI|nr:hypothetical protein H6P81_021734 [Aristolochia fimbriata]
MGLAPGPSQRTLLQTTIRTAKAARFSYWALPGSLAVTRGILRVFPPDLGSQSEQGLRSRRQLPAGVLFRARASDTTSSHAGPGRAEPPLVVPECPWGKVFFSQPRQGGQGRPICSPPTTRRTARGGAAGHGVGGEHVGRDAQTSMVRGILQFTPSIAFRHALHRSREPRYPLPRVALGYRVRVGPPQAFLFRLHRSRRVVVRVFASPTVAGADAEPVGRRVANAKRRIRRAFCTLAAPVPPLGIVESTMILPQVHLRKPYSPSLPLNDKVQWTSRNVIGGRTANAAATSNTSPTIQSVGADGRCVQRAGIVVNAELMTRLLGIPR